MLVHSVWGCPSVNVVDDECEFSSTSVLFGNLVVAPLPSVAYLLQDQGIAHRMWWIDEHVLKQDLVMANIGEPATHIGLLSSIRAVCNEEEGKREDLMRPRGDTHLYIACGV